MYAGTERVLYLIVAMVCKLCLKQLKDFSDFKAKYTTEYINAILENLSVVKALPSFESRQGDQGVLRKKMVKQNKLICRYFQRLLRYMTDGFDEDQMADMRRAAGGNLYDAARGNNWKASSDMQSNMSQFMVKYNVELTKGGMPAGFAQAFADDSAVFANLLDEFGTDKTSSGKDTQDKLTENNKLYKRIMNVMDDGKEIFVDDAAMVEQFSYRWLMMKLGGQGDTGFRFSLKAEGTLVPVTTASVSFLPSGSVFSIEEDETGLIPVYLPELKKDEFYSYLLTAPGYEEMAGTLVADTGVMHRVDLILKKAVMSATPQTDAEKIG